MPVAVTTFAIFAASQVGTPGPANMTLLATGARYGFRTTLPFVFGVVVGKQLVIWPVGFGLMQLAGSYPWVFELLKYVSATYIFWLAWKVANLRLSSERASDGAPGFLAGLMVHPLNPKAWAMIVGGFTGFVAPGTPALEATVTIAVVLLMCQLVLHPVWVLTGDGIARTLSGSQVEPYLMRGLALLTVVSVLFVLFGGGF
ncbi:MAG: LysE family translocator [Roseobacter sp.]